MLEDKLQNHLKERALLSPSDYTEYKFLNSTFLKRAVDSVRLAYRVLTRKIEKAEKFGAIRRSGYKIDNGEFVESRHPVYVTNDSVLDEESFNFLDSVRKPLRKYESDIPGMGPSYAYSPEEALKAFEVAQSLLPKLGYDKNLYPFQEIARDLVKRCIDCADLYVSFQHFDKVIEFADIGNELDARFNFGISPPEVIINKILDGITSFEIHYHFYDRAVERIELANRLNNRFNAGIDVKNIAGKIVESLIFDAERSYQGGHLQYALKIVNQAIDVGVKYGIKKYDEFRDLHSKISVKVATTT